MRKFIRKISPFNNETEMASPLYIIKKLLAFFVLYFLGAVIGEGIIFGIFYAMGYDPLHGELPDGDWVIRLSYYGYIIQIALTLLFWRLFEKRRLCDMGLNKKVGGFLKGVGIAVLLLAVIVAVSCISGVMRFEKISFNAKLSELALWLLAFAVQSSFEEILSRGFLQQALRRKVSLPMAIAVSAAAFSAPHFTTLFTFEKQYIVLGIVNLLLISGVFSMLTVICDNLWISCGMHALWNYIIYQIMGLSLSGIDATETGVIRMTVDNANIWYGGEYGLEAGAMCAVVMAVTLAVLILIYHKKKDGAKWNSTTDSIS